MSYLYRVSEDWCLAWPDFQRDVLGTHFSSARMGERRPYDWNRLSDALGIDPQALFSMSERWFFVQDSDTSRLTPHRIAIAPWTAAIGYSIYSPAALQRSPHIRLGWLRPDTLIDPTTRTLFLRRCFDCQTELGAITWSQATTLCPACSAPLAVAPQVEAPANIVEFASAFTARIEQQFRWKPVNFYSDTMVHCAAVWHVAELISKCPEFAGFAQQLGHESGFGWVAISETVTPVDVVQEALQYARSFAVADYACRMYPAITKRFQRLATYPRNLPKAPSAIRRGLSEEMLS